MSLEDHILKNFYNVGANFCEDIHLDEIPSTVNITDAYELQSYVFSDMERVINGCRMRAFVTPLDEGGLILQEPSIKKYDPMGMLMIDECDLVQQYQTCISDLDEQINEVNGTIREHEEHRMRIQIRIGEVRVQQGNVSDDEDPAKSLLERSALDMVIQTHETSLKNVTVECKNMRLEIAQLNASKLSYMDKCTHIKSQIQKTLLEVRKADSIAFSTATKASQHVLEEFRKVASKYQLLSICFHSASNYSQMDPLLHGDIRGIYENLKRAIYPQGKLGKITTNCRIFNHILALGKANTPPAQLWNYLVQAKLQADKMKWSDMSNSELCTLFMLVAMKPELRNQFLADQKLLHRFRVSKPDTSGPGGKRSTSPYSKISSQTTDDDIDYLQAMGEFLQTRQETQIQTSVFNQTNTSQVATPRPAIAAVATPNEAKPTGPKKDRTADKPESTPAAKSEAAVNAAESKPVPPREKRGDTKRQMCIAHFVKPAGCHRGKDCQFSHDNTNCVPVSSLNWCESKPVTETVETFHITTQEDSRLVRFAMDSQSTDNVTSKPALISNIITSPGATNITGIGGVVTSDQHGHINIDGIEAPFKIIRSERPIPTIVSLGRFIASENPEERRFTLLTSDGGVRGSLDPTLFQTMVEAANSGRIYGKLQLENYVFNEYHDLASLQDPESKISASDEVTCPTDIIPQSDFPVDTSESQNQLVNYDNEEETLDQSMWGSFTLVSSSDVQVSSDSTDVLPENANWTGPTASSSNELVHQFVSCGFPKSALINMATNGSIDNIPIKLTKDTILRYYREVGETVERGLATISRKSLDSSLKSDRSNVFGEVIQLDTIDPSFGRIAGEALGVIQSHGQNFTKVIIGVEESSNYFDIEGMRIDENKAQALRRFLDKIKVRCPNLRTVRADQEFGSVECKELFAQYGLEYLQSPPDDHRGGTGLVEGMIRHLQEVAQIAMNNLHLLVERKQLTLRQKVKFWYHAISYARMVLLMSPSYGDPLRTRYECAFKSKPNLKTLILLPFGTTLIVKVQKSEFGRGNQGIYLGPSLYIRGGINVYNLNTKRLVNTWCFKRANLMNSIANLQVEKITSELYGELTDEQHVSEPLSGQQIQSQGGERYQNHNADEPSPLKYWNEDAYLTWGEVVFWTDPQNGSQQAEVDTGAHSGNLDRPLKPIIPTRREIAKLPRWRRAIQREVKKLLESGTLQTRDKSVPMNIKMELIPVFAYKWKIDPDSGDHVWLETCRIVINGAQDTRDHDHVYAETPDQAVTLTSLSIAGYRQTEAENSDVVRAYLQADQTEDGVVAVPCKELKYGELGLDPEYDVKTAMYGDPLAAWQWQIKAEEGLYNVGCVKCTVTKSAYTKILEDESTIIIVRHSDDFLFTGITNSNRQLFHEFTNQLKLQYEMDPPSPVSRILGYEIKRCDRSGYLCPNGSIIMVTMKEKIASLYNEAEMHCKAFNPKQKERLTPCTVEIMRPEATDNPGTMDELLSPKDHTLFRSYLGKLMYIAVSYRHDIRFATFAMSLRSTKPRQWEMKCVLWCIEYLYRTIDLPLCIGGEEYRQLLVYGDATLGTAYEGRSIKGHFMKLSKNSGAIFASVHCVRCAVKSVFHAELAACADSIDTGLFITNVMTDFDAIVDDPEYPTWSTPIIHCDNAATVKWINGEKYNAQTRSLDPLFYSIRHLVQDESVKVIHVSGESNPADLLTKVLNPRDHWRHTSTIMGLELLRGVHIEGKFEVPDLIKEVDLGENVSESFRSWNSEGLE